MILVTHFACCHQYKGYWRSCPLGWSYFTVMPGLNLRAGGAHAPEFTGCTLTQLCYPGDASADLFTEWAEECEADEAIVLYSSFDTDASGGDGSLEPNTTYDDFQWILVRDNGGTWEVKTYGYG